MRRHRSTSFWSKALLSALLLASITIGCTRQQPAAPVKKPRHLLPPPPPPRMPTFAESRAKALARGAGDCSDLKRIKYLVAKAGQLGNDPYYDRIYVHPAEYRACLVESLSDATQIPAVHNGPGMQVTTVSDMASLMLNDMDLVPPNGCIPKDVRKEMETRGAFPFHRWRDDPANRRQWAACMQRTFAEQR